MGAISLPNEKNCTLGVSFWETRIFFLYEGDHRILKPTTYSVGILELFPLKLLISRLHLLNLVHKNYYYFYFNNFLSKRADNIKM